MDSAPIIATLIGLMAAVVYSSFVSAQIDPVTIGLRLMRPAPIEIGDRFGYSLVTSWGGHNAPTGIIVGAPGARNDTGAVYVYGWDDGGWTLNRIFYGDAVGDEYGHAVAAGDVTFDGIDDIVIGAPGAGQVHVFDGVTGKRIYRITWQDPVDDNNVRFGASVSAGQFNGLAHFGYHADIAIGSDKGVFIVYGCHGDIQFCRGVVDRWLPREADVMITDTGTDPIVSFVSDEDRPVDDLLVADRDAGRVFYIEGRENETGTLRLSAPEDARFTFTAIPPVSSIAGATVSERGPLLVAITSPTHVSVFDPFGFGDESAIATLGYGAGDGPITFQPWWRGGDLTGDGRSDVATAKTGVVFVYSGWRIAHPDGQQLEQVHHPVQDANMGAFVSSLAAVPETGELVVGMADAGRATVYELPPKWTREER